MSELDTTVAVAVMGWRQDFDCPIMDTDPPIIPYLLPDGSRRNSLDLPRYSTDISAAWQMEEDIFRRGHWREYGEALKTIVGTHPWNLAHASPLDRCRAAIAVFSC